MNNGFYKICVDKMFLLNSDSIFCVNVKYTLSLDNHGHTASTNFQPKLELLPILWLLTYCFIFCTTAFQYITFGLCVWHWFVRLQQKLITSLCDNFQANYLVIHIHKNGRVETIEIPFVIYYSIQFVKAFCVKYTESRVLWKTNWDILCRRCNLIIFV